jgi:hypothetical protein
MTDGLAIGTEKWMTNRIPMVSADANWRRVKSRGRAPTEFS